MGVYTKKAGAWTQVGVDPMAVLAAVVSSASVSPTVITNADGSVDNVYTFTADGSITLSKAGYARCLVVSSGASYASTYGPSGGRMIDGLFALPSGTLPIVVGAGGVGHGNPSSLGTVVYASRPALAASDVDATGAGGTAADWKLGLTSDITGTALLYARASASSPRANSGDGRLPPNTPSAAGVVVVRVRVSPALPLPAATGWAQITGGTVTEYTKPDGSVMEVHRFNASGTLTVVAAGYADVLLVSGGGSGGSAGYIGGGGRVADGLRALPAGALAVTVGAAGSDTVNPRAGEPSSIGTLATGPGQADQSAGAYSTGAGGTIASPRTGYTSAITGTAAVYAPAGDNTKPGGGGTQAGPTTPAAGVVIVAVQKTPPTASGVVASGGTESTFTGDGTNGVLGQGYKVHTFTASGSLVVSTAGVIDVLLVAGGGGGGGSGPGYAGGGGGGGDVIELLGVPLSAATHAVSVGAGGAGGANGGATSPEMVPGTAGGPSKVGGYVAAGGGGGGSVYSNASPPVGPGGPGGSSGGGGARNSSPAGVVTGAGFTGGLSSTSSAGGTNGGGGGGGAGGVGASGGSSNVGGAGGAGKSSSMNGTAVTYGAGGGGAGSGTGASGGSGAGNGGSAAAGTAATANRGGGGGGSGGNPNNGAAGGSGIVIVRYKV